MPSLLLIRPSTDAPLYLCDAVPYAYEEAGHQQFKAMPGISWIRDRESPNGRGYYQGPREAVELVAAILESAGVVKVRRDPKILLERTLRSAAGVCARLAPSDGGRQIWPDGFRDYQIDGVAWLNHMLRHSGAALLADEMGIGKSAQAIAAVDALDIDGQQATCIIVCPAIVRAHWRNQVLRWTRMPDFYAVYSYEGATKALKSGEIGAATICILDEIHYCSNPKAARTKAARELRNRCEFAIGLSGTPMTTRPRDLHEPLDILWPGRFGKAFLFQKRYCDGRFVEIPHVEKSVWQADGVSRSDELAIRLQAVMLRRTKSQVALELPPRTRIVHDVELPKAAKKDLISAQAMIAMGAKNVWGGQVSELLSGLETYKVKHAIELAQEIISSGSRPLILTTRKATAREIGHRLGAPIADGDVAADERQALLSAAPCGVATIYAVTTGIDLIGYDSIIMVGLDWVPSTLLQAEARIHRLGQSKPVTIHYLIGLGTLDEVVRERVIARLETWDQLSGGGGDEAAMAAAIGGGTEDDLIAGIVTAIGRAA